NSVGNLDFDPTELVVVANLQNGSPAEQAGVQKGDKIIAINGSTVTGIDSFRSLVQQNKENSIQMAIIRNNQPTEIELRPKIGEDGKAIIGANLSNQSLDKEKASIGQAAAFAWNSNIEILRLTGKAF